MTPVKLIPAIKWPIIASLHVLPRSTFPIQNFSILGWNIFFLYYMNPFRISQAMHPIESKLNQYLEKSVNTVANQLIIPFNCKMTATSNPLIYRFKIAVFTQSPLRKIPTPFNYPPEPVYRLNNFFIEAVVSRDSPSNSHITTVTLKPPPN